MGLLDSFLPEDPNQNQAARVGLLNLGAALLGSRSPYFGQALGQGAAAGVQGYQHQLQQNRENQMGNLQLENAKLQQQTLKSKMADEDRVRQFYGNLDQFTASPISQALAAGAQAGSRGPTLANLSLIDKAQTAGSQFDAPAMYRAMLASGSPTLAAQGLQGLVKDDSPIALAEGGKLVTKSGRELASNASSKPINGYLVPDGKGGYRVDSTLFEAERTLKATGAPKTNVSVNQGYESSFKKELGQLDAKTLDGLRAKAEAGKGMLTSLNRLEQLNGHVYSGGGANAKMDTVNFLQGMGVNIGDPTKLAKSQEFNALTTKLVMDSLGGSLGPGVSNSDVTFIKQTVPQLATNPQARTSMMEFMRKKAQQQVLGYQQARSYAEKNNGLTGYMPQDREVVRTGMYGGKKVIQYADGTTEYAD